MTGITTFDERLKQQKEAVAQNKADRDTTINTLYDDQKTVATDEYNRAIEQTEKDYADQYQKNAVQKLINERQIAESMANLGLTDSGLNRTQQTAAQLSYANQKGKLDIAKQQSLDEKSSALASAIATIEQNRLTALDENKTYWEGVANDNALSLYQADVDAYTKLQEAQIEAAAEVEKERISSIKANYGAGGTSTGNYILQTSGGLLSRDYSGSLADNNVNVIYDSVNKKVTYVDNNSGKKSTFNYGVNPYTGNDNLNENTSTAKAAQKYGTFGNSYQPKGIIGKGELKKADTTPYKGNTQNVYKTSVNSRNTEYWIWDGASNQYLEVKMVTDPTDGKTKWKLAS